MSMKQHLKYYTNNVTSAVKRIHTRDSLQIQSEPPIDHNKFKSGCGWTPFWIISILVAVFIISAMVTHEEWKKLSNIRRSGAQKDIFPGERELLESSRVIYVILILLWLASLPGKDEKLPAYIFARFWTTVLCILIVLWSLFPACLALFVYNSLNVLLIIISALVTASTAILLTVFCSHFLPYHYDPYFYNERWNLVRRISKNNQIEVVRSRAFEIVIKNIGEQPWRSKPGFVIHRSSGIQHRRWKTEIPLPRDILLLPEKTVTLIPYTETYPHGATKVHEFRCFGYDKGDWTQTIIKNADPNNKNILGQLDEQYECVENGQQWKEVKEIVVTTEGEETFRLL